MRWGPSFALLAATLLLAPGGAQARFMPSVYRLVATSADGRLVAFESPAGDLVPGDSNGVSDVFLRDRLTGTTELVSVGAGGAPADGPSISPAISADGRYVAFVSSATNLIPGARLSGTGLYLRDRALRLTTRLAPGAGGIPPNVARGVSISGDGRLVAFASDAPNLVPGDTNGALDVFVYDIQARTIQRISTGPGRVQGDGDSYDPVMTPDGRYVAYASFATGLVPGDTNGALDVFVYDRYTDKTERVSVATGGAEGNATSGVPSLSADGRFVVFGSHATNLVPGDTNGQVDVFLRDRSTQTTSRVSLGRGGVQGDGWSVDPVISADGRYVAFAADATNLVPGDTNGVRDIFVRDRTLGTTTRVSVGPRGLQGDGVSYSPAMSRDGHVVAFFSFATDLAPGGRSGLGDVFVWTP